MKKIVSAVALAAVAASFATAEIKTSLNVRAGGNVFEKQDTSKDAVTIMDLDAVTGTDALTFSASNDYAGVKLNYNPKLYSGDKDNPNPSKVFWSAGNGVELTAWMNPTDWLKLQVGATKDGLFYVEQCKKDTDDTNWAAAGKYAFLYKPGVLTKNSSAFYLDSLVDIQNNGNQYAMANFTFADVAGGNLGFDLVATDISGLQKKFLDDNDKNVSVAPGARVWLKNEAVNVNVDFQMPTEKDIAAGVYVSPLGLVDNSLQLMVGGTVSANTEDAAGKFGIGKADTTFYAADLRLRYVSGDFHIANAFNFTGASEDDSVKGGNGSKKTGDMQIWDAVFLTYKVNDNWTVTGDVQIDAVTGVGKDDDTYLDLYVTPGVMYTVGKGAAITGGLNFIVTDLSDVAGKKTSVALPVIFRVKM